MASSSTKTQTQKITSVSVSKLKSSNIIHIEGDLISFENLTKSIERYGVMAPIFINSDNQVISGHRRVLVSQDLLIDTIPAIVVDSDITPLEIEKLKIDFLITQRNLSHLDIIQIYQYQKSVFDDFNESYAVYMGKLLDCDKRTIQLKVRAGKMYLKLPSEVKNIFQTLDSTKKVPFKTFKVMSNLEKIDLANFIKEVLEVENLAHKNLSSITSEYEQMFNRKERNKEINEESQKSKKSKEITLSEILKNAKPTNELKSSGDSDSKNETATVSDMKKVLNYEIRKYFNLGVDTTEESEINILQSKFHINFTEEIEFISSLLLEEAA